MMPDPTLPIAACAALEAAINFAIGLDASIAARFASHSGRVLKLYADNPALTVYIELGERCRVMYHYSGEPDAALGGTLADWIELARSEDKTAALVNGNLSIRGDSKILLSIGELAGELDIDWEAQLAEVIGDVPANLAGRAARNAAQIGTQAAGAARIALDNIIQQHNAAQAEGAPADLIGDGLRALREGLDRVAKPGSGKTNAGHDGAQNGSQKGGAK